MPDALRIELERFEREKSFRGKGPLCVALVVTQHARDGLPLDPAKLVTEGGGQVLGLGKGSVQAILKKHGIARVLAQEGGRTSRGSLGNMREYVAFLNSLNESGLVDLDAIEKFWIDSVCRYFAGKPFKVRLDGSRSLRMLVRDLITEAEERQRGAPGMHYAGAVLQHLVGAKLDCAMGRGRFEHNSFSTSDEQSGRAGDFLVGDVVIHVTTSPSEALIARCQTNLDAGLKPIIVTLSRGVAGAELLAENASLSERIDIFEGEQFVALNLYELGKFEGNQRRVAVTDLVERYNQIVEEFETDPSLQVELR